MSNENTSAGFYSRERSGAALADVNAHRVGEINWTAPPPPVVKDPVCRARFQRSARLQAQIRHAGVPAVYSADLEGDIPYFAIELVEGHTLAEFLRAAGPLPSGIVALIGCNVARTLQDIHDAEAVHRQLTPAHILIDRNPHTRSKRGLEVASSSGPRPTLMAKG